MPSLEEDFLNQLPEWAIAVTPGRLELGAQLPTRDGRRMGNAHIVHIDHSHHYSKEALYTVLTDAGSTMHMSAAEIAECFHPPVWISDVAEVKRKFDRSSPDQ